MHIKFFRHLPPLKQVLTQAILVSNSPCASKDGLELLILLPLPPENAGITGMHHHVQFFFYMLGIKTQVSMLKGLQIDCLVHFLSVCSQWLSLFLCPGQ